MIKSQMLLQSVNNNRGVTIVIVAICLVVLIGIASLAIDIGYLYSTRNELQNTADAAALAGAGYLGSVYLTLPQLDQQNYAFTRKDVVDVINAVAEKNKAAGINITINDNDQDIIIGQWIVDEDNPNNSRVDPTLIGADAVQVTARRDGAANTPITTFFARVFGIDTMSVAAAATAALTGPTTVAEGELKLPFGVSEKIFNRPCTELIQLSPTPESCAGWHNFTYPHNKSELEKTFLGLIEGHTFRDYCKGCTDSLWLGNQWLDTNFDLNKTPAEKVIPQTTAPIYFDFIGGDVASLFTGVSLDGSYDSGVYPPAPGNYGDLIKANGDPATNKSGPALFETLFDYFRYRDGDGNPMQWSATVPVYEDNSDGGCTNPSGDLKIIYFAKIVVTMPNPPPDKTINVTWACEKTVISGRGGGAPGNLKGSIPNLVK